MRQLAELGRGAEVPVVAVIGRIFRALDGDAGHRIERQVIGRPDDAGGFAGRTRTVLELHRGLARPARAGEVGGEVLAVEFDDAVDLGIGAGILAGAADDLHQVNDLVPAGLVELELQRIAGRVAAGALIVEDALGLRVGIGVLRQRRGEHFRRQLADALLGIGDGRELEILVLGRREVDLILGGVEAERLGPDAVFAVGHRREEILPALVGVDAGRDGRAFLLGGDLHAVELLAGGGSDRAGQKLVGRSRGRHQRRRNGKAGNARQ